ncbi:hypothetical protein KP509_21G032600 [Ceratopteris richardii]|uniref:Uncharacterized protein n=1 Tax=Ceratopteris richardii TaxID=49495 RepID=A0A8T2SBV4_CERRI|nr:hypothetical protein KP509_21G032600 [Ceratopteris richardii]
MCYLHFLTWGTTYLGVEWAYRTAFKVTTKHTPFQLVYGLDAIAPLEFLKGSSRLGHPRIDNLQVISNINVNRLHQLEEKRTIADSTLEKELMKWKAWHDRNLWKTEIKEGSLVLLYQPSLYNKKEKKLSTGWIGPYKVKEILPQGAVRLSTLEGTQIPLVNWSRLKPYQLSHQTR